MGHVRSRFSATFPAKAQPYPEKIALKSFVNKILPVSPTGSRFCAENVRISMKTRIYGGGRGYSNALCAENALLSFGALRSAAFKKALCDRSATSWQPTPLVFRRFPSQSEAKMRQG